MRQKTLHKLWLLALSFMIGLGLTLIVTSLASAQKAQIGVAAQIPNGRSEQGPRQTDGSPASPTPAERYYVSKSGDGSDGLSWTTAFNQVQDALAVAISGDEIWVATGLYTPGVTISDSFNLVSGVEIFGGFAGGETELGQRDWAANPTVLSGDIGGDDITDPDGVVNKTLNIVGENSLHVVYADGAGGTPITGTTVLDGFSITGGQADSSFPDNLGGGFFCAGSGNGSECSPSLINVTFSGNSAANYGGAIYNYGSNNGISSPSLSDVTFSGNSAGLYGGAIYNDGAHGVSSPSLMNVTFSGNKAVVRGGAIYNYGPNNGISSPSLVDVTFSANSAGAYGGAIYNFGQQGDSSPSLVNVTFSGNSGGGYGGALYNLGFMGASNPSLVNVTFSGNSAIYGGAIYNDGQQGASSPSLVNVTFSGNYAVIRGGAIFNYGYSSGNSSPSLVNVILWNNFASSGGAEMYNFEASPTITASLVRGGITGAWVGNSVGSSVTDGGGNIDGDPLFARDPDPGDDSWTTLADNDYGDLRLTYGSPAIDAGTNLPALPPTDLDGNPRIINGVVDMGAYESLLEVFLPLVMR